MAGISIIFRSNPQNPHQVHHVSRPRRGPRKDRQEVGSHKEGAKKSSRRRQGPRDRLTSTPSSQLQGKNSDGVGTHSGRQTYNLHGVKSRPLALGASPPTWQRTFMARGELSILQNRLNRYNARQSRRGGTVKVKDELKIHLHHSRLPKGPLRKRLKTGPSSVRSLVSDFAQRVLETEPI